MYKYVISNDWHIGSEVCQREKIIHLLKHIKTETLVLNGDIIDVEHTKRLKKKDWEILSLLRKLSKTVRIIYIRGNHDSKISEMICDLLGFEFHKEFDFELNGKKFHITHGDYFDFFISKYWLLTEIATGLYYWIQRFSTPKQVIARILKKRSKNFIKCVEKIKERASKFAIDEGYDYVVCGHTHHHYFKDGDKYINTGCFTEAECSYLTIKNGGEINLVKNH